jgi:cyanophycinase
MNTRCVLLLALALLLGASHAVAGKKPPYEYYVVGSDADVVVPPPASPSAVLMGGGPDVDAAFQWMIARAGGGDFVVIRATGTDAYNPYIYAMAGVDSVETLVIPSREAANDPFVIDRINKADALFIAGGDQRDYILSWKGTGVDTALQGLIARHVPVGGTSAGLAVLGEVDFAALNGTVTSADALGNPYGRRMTLDRGFITAPWLAGAITDAHLDARDRMGRLVTFMARMAQDAWVAAPRGVGVDVETALVVENGLGTRLGVGSVYFLEGGVPQVCQKKMPLTYFDVSVQRLSGSGTFDLVHWQGNGSTTAYSLNAEAGVLSSTQPGGGIY